MELFTRGRDRTTMAEDVHITKMSSTVSVFSCFYLLFCLTVYASEGEVQPLYDSNDAVFNLDHENFNGKVFESEAAWFVEFYSSWCGHCQNFAPTWKKVALNVKGTCPSV